MIHDDADTLTDALMALAAVKLARTLPRAQLRAIVAALRDNDAHALADAVIGALPFGAEREWRVGMMQ